MWKVHTVPTVWYINCPRQCGMLLFRQCIILTLPTIWNVITVPTVWYFNCSRQCGMFLRFQQCGILAVPDSVECSYCCNSVLFELSPTMWNVFTVPTVL